MPKGRPEPFKPLSDFMEAYAKEHGRYDQPATYDVLREKFGVAGGTITSWMRGYPPMRDTAKKAADNAGIPRSTFLPACGYLPNEEDLVYDEGRYQTDTRPVREFMAYLDTLPVVEVEEEPASAKKKG